MAFYTQYFPSPLGLLQLSCCDEYLRTIHFLEKEPHSEAKSHPLLEMAGRQLEEYFSGHRKTFDLPLCLDGTAFQKKVWELLLDISYGKTISYSQLAKKYGDLKAIRAVAAANGKNNLAIVIPCHRVIGSNQSLTGYAGGLWRKKWLLELEAAHFRGVQNLF